jgi:hypothetical protein
LSKQNEIKICHPDDYVFFTTMVRTASSNDGGPVIATTVVTIAVVLANRKLATVNILK